MTEEVGDDCPLCCPHENDPKVPDDAVLYRRLPPHHVKPSPDHELGSRHTSNCFQDPDPQGVSVYVAALLAVEGLGPDDIVAGMGPGWGVAETTAGAARALGFGVRLRPDPAVADDPRNAAHAELTGLKKGKDGQRQAKDLTKPPTRLILVTS